MCHNIVCQWEAIRIAIHHLVAIPKGIVVAHIIMNSGNDRHPMVIDTVATMLICIKGVGTYGILVGSIRVRIGVVCAAWVRLIAEQRTG